MINLLATDLDGTLLRSDLTVSDVTRDALAQAAAAGIEVVFVTGRPPRWLGPALDETGHSGPVIAGNGAVVIDGRERSLIEARCISRDVCLEVVDRLLRLDSSFGFAVEVVPDLANGPLPLDQVTAFGHDPSYAPKWTPPPETVIAPIRDLLESGGAIKLLARATAGTRHVDELLRLAEQELVGLVHATHSNSADLLLEMSAWGVTKASTLSELAAERGWGPADVAAVGDMPNDLPMLRWAGHGYAVAGAHAEVLEAVGADRVIGSNDDDAVARLLLGFVASKVG